ncbi:MAG: carbohydrate ABC transporter permease [Paracoccaceae bacterium]
MSDTLRPGTYSPLKHAGRYALMCALAFLALAPLLWMFLSSLRPTQEMFSYAGSFSWHTIWPETFTFSNYTGLLETGFPRAIGNSLFVAGVTMVIGVLVNAAAAFAFATFEFRFRGPLFLLVLMTAMMPFEAIVLPLYMLVNGLGMIDTYSVLIVPELANGFVILMFRQFFAAIPRELYEAGRIDGASWLRIFFFIALPVSWPVILTGSIMIFITQFEAFFWPLVAAPSAELTVAQVEIAKNISLEGANWGLLFSSMSIVCVIAALPFLVFQRFYIRNVASSGIK